MKTFSILGFLVLGIALVFVVVQLNEQRQNIDELRNELEQQSMDEKQAEQKTPVIDESLAKQIEELAQQQRIATEQRAIINTQLEMLSKSKNELVGKVAELSIEPVGKQMLKDEQQELRKQLVTHEQNIAALTLHIKQLEQKPEEAKQVQQTWSDLSARYEESLFLCVAMNPKTGTIGIGTAFVVDEEKGLLATNAHIVQLLRAMPKRFVVQNKTGNIFEIKRAAHNPLFVTLSSPDVGMIEINADGVALKNLPLASAQELGALRAGTQIATLGFPGELQDQYIADPSAQQHPGVLATFKQGWIGRVSNYSGVQVTADKNVLIQHSASLSSGTSGSPIFTKNGKVIAVSSSSMTSSFKVGSVRTRELLSAAQIAFAVRIDELQSFIRSAQLQTLP